MKITSHPFLFFILISSSSALWAEKNSDSREQLEMSALVCKQDQQAAVSAVASRDIGKTKEEMEKFLPERGPRNNRMAQLMYEILDDVYGVPEIKRFPYCIFRTEVCFREAQRKPVPANFRSVAEDILTCQTKYGEEASNEIIDCIQDAITKGTGTKK